MCRRMDKQKKQNMLDILVKPDISIERCDYTEYLNEPVKYYKVFYAQSAKPLMELSVTPEILGLDRYEVILQNKKYSHLIRTNAIFHTPMAADIMEVYNWLKLRYLVQQSKARTK